MNYEANEKRLEKSELLEELLAMIKTCFEGEAIIFEEKIRMRLPSGEGYVLTLESCE